jgi:septal ring factor EnvC (AmiA/AmiB activator)
MTYTIIKQTTVKGHGYSYQLNNKKDAQKLCQTLNQYEKTTTLNHNIEQQHDHLTKQIIQLQMSIKIIEHEINTIGETINELNSTD